LGKTLFDEIEVNLVTAAAQYV